MLGILELQQETSQACQRNFPPVASTSISSTLAQATDFGKPLQEVDLFDVVSPVSCMTNYTDITKIGEGAVAQECCYTFSY